MFDIITLQGNANQSHGEGRGLTPVNTAFINKTRNYKGWRECGEKGTLVHGWQGGRRAERLLKKILKQLKTESPHGPAVLVRVMYPKETKSLSQRDTHTPVLTPVFTAGVCVTAYRHTP